MQGQISSEDFKKIAVDGLITDIDNGDLGNADTSYTYVAWGNQGYDKGTMQMLITATTITIEASNDLETVANASAVWTDVTNTIFGVANVTASGDLIFDTPVNFARLRVKRVTTNATNAFELRMARSN